MTTGCGGDTALWELSLGDQGGLLGGRRTTLGSEQDKGPAGGRRGTRPTGMLSRLLSAQMYLSGETVRPGCDCPRGRFFLNQIIKVLSRLVSVPGPHLCEGLEMGDI